MSLSILAKFPCTCGCGCGNLGVLIKHPTGAIWFGVPESLDAFVEGLRAAGAATWPKEG